MSSNRERRRSSLSIDQKVSTAGYGRFWEMKLAQGKNARGEMQYREAFVDMASGRQGGEKDVYLPDEHGWNASLPDLPSGDPGKCPAYEPPSQRYRERYDHIDWSA